MKIVGLQKLTLLDYPGRIACTVFLNGCNFRCPFCHNSELLEEAAAPFMEPEVLLAFLRTRKNILDGVCITGGEPTLHPQLPELLRQIRAMGFSVKLDTNGYRPDVLRTLVTEGLVDYVAMDVKNDPIRYGCTAGVETLELNRIEQSICFLMNSPVDYELRTTVVHPLHSEATVRSMCRWLLTLESDRKIKKLFLQPFVDRDTVPTAGLSAPDALTLQTYAEILRPCAETVALRGV